MSLGSPCSTLTPHGHARYPNTRVWRPFPRDVVDIVGVENHDGDMVVRMHPWFAISLVRSPAVVTVESRRDVAAHRNAIVLIPPFQLYGLRALGEPGEGNVTFLLRGTEFSGCGLPAHAALLTDPTFGEQIAGLMSRLLSPVASVEHATTLRSMVEQLSTRSSPMTADRSRRSSPLAPVRAYLKANVNEPVPIEDVADMSGLSESQFIRAFHYEFGLPPHAYHLRVRLAAVCELLTRGVSVARVANECGFADQSHLNRRFKSVYGVTPATWAVGSYARGNHAGVFAGTIDGPPKLTSVSFRRTGRGTRAGL